MLFLCKINCIGQLISILNKLLCYTWNLDRKRKCPAIISRNTWGAAKPSRQIAYLPIPVTHVFVHHTDDGGSCFESYNCQKRVRALQSYHQRNKNWPDIAWNFLIGGDGRVYEGLGWDREGYHTLNWNRQSLGVAFIGNFEDSTPSYRMLDSFKDLLFCGIQLGYLPVDYSLHGHSDARATSCPGRYLYDSISRWDNFKRGPLPGYGDAQERTVQQKIL